MDLAVLLRGRCIFTITEASLSVGNLIIDANDLCFMETTDRSVLMDPGAPLPSLFEHNR